MRSIKALFAAIALATGSGLFAQSAAPEIAFESRADLLRFPDAADTIATLGLTI